MAKRNEEEKKPKKVKAKEYHYKIKTVIAEDQRKYIEEVREWLHDSLRGKGKIVGGPI
jgi:hypothetical protein